MMVLFAVIMALLLIAGCSSDQGKRQESADNKPAEMNSSTPYIAGGISWSIPADWNTAPDRQMRVQTYIISPADGDSDSAECAVFYFGPTSGGGTDANLDRWAGQFEQPDGANSKDKASINKSEAHGLQITTIDLTGTFLVSGGPMMQVSEKKEGYRLLGAIVEGPQGSVFFKMTGPEKTMAAAQNGFNSMLSTMQPVSM